MAINFFYGDTKNLHLNTKSLVKRFERIAFFEGYSIGQINFIFVSDRTILLVNKKFLKHNYPTDVITFGNCSESDISGDIYISLDTVKFNSINLNVGYSNEIFRVMVHGMLHLFGYKDKSFEEKKAMRRMEDRYLRLFRG